MSSVISVVGRSNSGKTTLLEKLIKELKGRGYKLSVIKHCSHGFDIDQPGKDSWRFKKAGGDTVVLSSPGQVGLIKSVVQEASLDDLLYQIGDEYDLVLTEGFKGSHAPKIEVHQSGSELLSPVDELLAVISSDSLDVPVPRYSPDEVEALADLIDEKVFAQNKGEDILLFVNGTQIRLNSFVKGLFSKTLLGMVSTLKGVDEVKSLRISLSRGLDCRGPD